jgi:hypothetical protein
MAVTFGAGMVLLVIEVVMARKKRGGFTPTDRQRCFGIFWLSIFAALLVGFLFWMTPD